MEEPARASTIAVPRIALPTANVLNIEASNMARSHIWRTGNTVTGRFVP
jgi:hypothetical protein